MWTKNMKREVLPHILTRNGGTFGEHDITWCQRSRCQLTSYTCSMITMFHRGWPTKPFMKNSLSICTSNPVHWDETKELVCQSLGSGPAQAQELFTLVTHLFGTTSNCLSVQPFQLLPASNISLTWPFPHRHQHTWWPVDVTKLCHIFGCCWLSRHWAYWLCIILLFQDLRFEFPV